MALPRGLDFVTYIDRVFSLDVQNQINQQAKQWLKETQADPLLDYSLDFTAAATPFLRIHANILK